MNNRPNGQYIGGGIGGAAPRNMPRFSSRGYAVGGLADTMPMGPPAGGPPMGPPMGPPPMGPPPMGPPPMGPPPMGPPGQGEDLQQRVTEVVHALISGGPEGEPIIRAFVEDFGEEALMEVIEGMSVAQGDGMSDDIPARIDGGEEVQLSSGEYVVPADAVSDLGNGSSEAGARELMDMIDRLRSSRHGTVEQPPPVDPRGMMPS